MNTSDPHNTLRTIMDLESAHTPITITSGPIPGSKPQYSESAFRTYEPYITSILASLPTATCINPYPRSPETFTHRLRDAIRAYVNSTWLSPISRDLLRATFAFFSSGGTFIITYGQDPSGITHVYVGPRAHHSINPTGVRSANITRPALPGEIDASEQPAVFAAFATLKNQDLVTGMITFCNVSDTQIKDVEENFPNVELLHEGVTTKMF